MCPAGIAALALLLPTLAVAAQTSPVNGSAAPDTSAVKISIDSSVVKLPSDTLKTIKTAARAKADTDMIAAAKDSFNVRSATTVGVGIGLSLGGNRLFSLWEKGLPKSLADFGLNARSFVQGADTMPLTFAIKETPDVYNMTFPVAVSLTRLSSSSRWQAVVSFSWLSKDSRSTVTIGDDSVGRRIAITRSLGLYTVTLDLLYGRAIPERYFSITGADRTDIVIGISASPFIALRKSATAGFPSGDARLSAASDSMASRLHPVSATGMAFGWRVGIVKLSRLSRHGGLDAGLTYSGLWSTLFRTRSGGTLTEQDISAGSVQDGTRVSYFSSRIDLFFSFINKVR
jgi:hypothetical protein